MIVVAIIGILAAVAVPNFQTYQAKARQAEAKSNLSSIFTAEHVFSTENSTFTQDLESAGFVLLDTTPSGTKPDQGQTDALAKVVKRYYSLGFSSTACATTLCTNGTLNKSRWRYNNSITPVYMPDVSASCLASESYFTVCAAGKIYKNLYDAWSINQNKNLTQFRDGITGANQSSNPPTPGI